MKKILTFAILALPLMLWAEQPVQKGERYDDATIIHETPTPASTQARLDDLAGEPVTAVLQPEFKQLEDQYQVLLDQLRAQIEIAAPEQQEALELQAISLKQELHEARLETVLKYVRATSNSEAEARVLAAIEALRKPTPFQKAHVERDPLTGEEKKGAGK